jgi:serine/threonine protein kinase
MAEATLISQQPEEPPSAQEGAGADCSGLGSQPVPRDLRQFLSQAGQLGGDLASLLRTDLQKRWQAGERVPAEAYLRDDLPWSCDAELAVDLVYQEFLAREELAEMPTAEEYQRRFPHLASQIGRQIAFDRGLDGTKTLDSATQGLDTNRRQDALKASSSEVGREFCGYELLEEIDRGGMGVVFKARQVNLNRIVALKMILAGELASEDDVRRFHIEAEAAANLDHPGIVPIYEVGQHEGQHFFSMSFVEGQSLAAKLAQGPLPPREAAELILELARAIDFAHQHGVIHRDLKPSNILLDSHGHPRVTDFGLAKRLSGNTPVTATGALLGTPSYMSPEQAEGDVHHIGPASDIYSLGAVLYELLTGRPPFRAKTVWDTLLQVKDCEPAPPRLVNPDVPHDLQTIALKCLEKDPARRYPSAQALAAELQRFLDGEPIRASSVNLLNRLTRALSQSRNEQYLQGWGLALILFGGIVFACHVVMYALTSAGVGLVGANVLPRAVMFLLIGLTLVIGRQQSFFPINSVERIIWVVWIAYILAYVALEVALVLQGRTDLIYALAAILAGMGFFILGCHVWGPCYAMGIAFFVAAPFLAQRPLLSILGFGTLWGFALTVLGLHYYRRGGKTLQREREPAGPELTVLHQPSPS